jgi:hypothetical protein
MKSLEEMQQIGIITVLAAKCHFDFDVWVKVLIQQFLCVNDKNYTSPS